MFKVICFFCFFNNNLQQWGRREVNFITPHQVFLMIARDFSKQNPPSAYKVLDNVVLPNVENVSIIGINVQRPALGYYQLRHQARHETGHKYQGITGLPFHPKAYARAPIRPTCLIPRAACMFVLGADLRLDRTLLSKIGLGCVLTIFYYRICNNFYNIFFSAAYLFQRLWLHFFDSLHS